MKNNQSYQYFTWGSHQHHNRPFYTLGDWTSRRLYFTSEDHHRIKLIQFILLPWKHLVFMDLTRTMNYAPPLVDNSVCLNWFFRNVTQSSKTGLGFTGTWLAARRSFIEDGKTDPSDTELDTQKKIFVISRVLDAMDEFDSIVIGNIEQDLYHNIGLKEYCRMVLPNDLAVQQLIDKDQQSIESSHPRLATAAACRQALLQILSSRDYLQTADQLIDDLVSEINLRHDMDRTWRESMIGSLS